MRIANGFFIFLCVYDCVCKKTCTYGRKSGERTAIIQSCANLLWIAKWPYGVINRLAHTNWTWLTVLIFFLSTYARKWRCISHNFIIFLFFSPSHFPQHNININMKEEQQREHRSEVKCHKRLSLAFYLKVYVHLHN